jgi:hypothetical protein
LQALDCCLQLRDSREKALTISGEKLQAVNGRLAQLIALKGHQSKFRLDQHLLTVPGDQVSFNNASTPEFQGYRTTNCANCAHEEQQCDSERSFWKEMRFSAHTQISTSTRRGMVEDFSNLISSNRCQEPRAEVALPCRDAADTLHGSSCAAFTSACGKRDRSWQDAAQTRSNHSTKSFYTARQIIAASPTTNE